MRRHMISHYMLNPDLLTNLNKRICGSSSDNVKENYIFNKSNQTVVFQTHRFSASAFVTF
jgi:hypothetical protein